MSPSACSSKKTSSGDSIRPTCTTTHVQRTVSRLRPRCLINALRSPVVLSFRDNFWYQSSLTPSCPWLTLAPMGLRPWMRMARLSTSPPISYEIGGVSDHPPARSTRAEA